MLALAHSPIPFSQLRSKARRLVRAGSRIYSTCMCESRTPCVCWGPFKTIHAEVTHAGGARLEEVDADKIGSLQASPRFLDTRPPSPTSECPHSLQRCIGCNQRSFEEPALTAQAMPERLPIIFLPPPLGWLCVASQKGE